MERNPYAETASPGANAPNAPTLTPEQQKLRDYEIAVGKNADFYLPKFERFDGGGSRVGWNWPAFFLTGPYFLYRKMWLPGLLYIFLPMMLFIVLAIVVAAVGKEWAGAILIAGVILYLLPWILMPMFANSLYWRKVNRVIAEIPPNVAAQPDKRERRLERNGGTSLAVSLLVSIFGGSWIVGVLAAISIPAYMDYTIRAQVTEGLNEATTAKIHVAEYYAQTKLWPADNAAAGYAGATGDFIASVEIDQGAVIISYGNKANDMLVKEGGRLVLTPGLSEAGDVVWVCGNAAAPEGVTLVENAPGGAEIPNKYLPSGCR